MTWLTGWNFTPSQIFEFHWLSFIDWVSQESYLFFCFRKTTKRNSCWNNQLWPGRNGACAAGSLLKEMTLGVRVRVIPNAIHHKYPARHHHHFTLFMYFSQQYNMSHCLLQFYFLSVVTVGENPRLNQSSFGWILNHPKWVAHWGWKMFWSSWVSDYGHRKYSCSTSTRQECAKQRQQQRGAGTDVEAHVDFGLAGCRSVRYYS